MLFSLQIIHLLLILQPIYQSQNDLKEITRIYYKYNKYISNCSQANVLEILNKYWELSFVDSSYVFSDTNGQDIFDIKIDPIVFREVFDLFFKQFISDERDKIFIKNPRLQSCFINALNYAADDEPCLIIGETGTGKEGVAKIIHKFSRRSENIFWAVNCSGFTESLFDSEISGVVAGAATGVRTRLGAFLAACGKEENGKRKSGYYVHAEQNKDHEEIRFKIDGKDIGIDPKDENLKKFGGTLFLDEYISCQFPFKPSCLD